MSKDLNDAIRFGFLVHDVSRLRCVTGDRVLKPLGVTRAQWWVLTFLSRRDGMTQTALAADLDLTKVAVGGILERMEVAELVQRRPDECDARIRRVYLTRTGSRLIEQIRKQIGGFELEVLASSTDEEVATTIRTLRGMKETLLRIIAEGGGHADMDNGAKVTRQNSAG